MNSRRVATAAQPCKQCGDPFASPAFSGLCDPCYYPELFGRCRLCDGRTLADAGYRDGGYCPACRSANAVLAAIEDEVAAATRP